jgi:BCS1 N terminal
MSDMTNGALLLMLSGSAIALFRKLPDHFMFWAKKKVSVSMTVDPRDESYGWIKLWLSANVHTKLLQVFTKPSDDIQLGDTRPAIHFSPSDGRHWFRFHGKLGCVYIEKPQGGNEALLSLVAKESGRSETQFKIQIFGGTRSTIQAIVEEARNIAMPIDNKIAIRVEHARYSLGIHYSNT